MYLHQEKLASRFVLAYSNDYQSKKVKSWKGKRFRCVVEKKKGKKKKSQINI